MDVVEHQTLLEPGKQIRHHFTDLKVSLAEASPKFSSNAVASLAHVSDRFFLWASNIGLFSPSHASLDYRLRNNDQVRVFANELLLTLAGLLKNLVGISVGIRRPFEALNTDAHLGGDGADQEYSNANADNAEEEYRSRGSSTGSSSLDSNIDIVFGGVNEDSHETEAELLIEQISSLIDQLSSLALQIRNPANRKAPAVERIDLYKHLRPEFKDEYIKTREKMEYEGLVQMLQQCRKEANPADSDNGHEPDLDEIDKALLCRFMKANHNRRCNFHYWKRYKIKSSHFTFTSDRAAPSVPRTAISRQLGPLSVIPSNISHQVSSNLTSAIPLPANFVLEKSIAPSTQSSRVPTVMEKGPDGLVVRWPIPPGGYYSRGKTKDFECPHCFFFCSSRTARPEAWKHHLRFDLQPYQCTYEDCSEADILYHDFDAWNLHEQRMHHRIWVCHLDKADFTERSAYESHVHTIHPEKATLLLDPEMISFRETTRKECDRPCPICLKGFKRALDLQKHLSIHLEAIALLALPPEAQEDSDDEASVQSQRAERRHAMIARSLANDFPEAGSEPLTFDENENEQGVAAATYTGSKLTPESLLSISQQPWSVFPPPGNTEGIVLWIHDLPEYSLDASVVIGELAGPRPEPQQHDMPQESEEVISNLQLAGEHRDPASYESVKAEKNLESFPTIRPQSESVQEGILVLADPVNADVDIVFIHGLGGDRIWTWTHDGADRTLMWPQELLPQTFPTARTMTFGYNASFEDFFPSRTAIISRPILHFSLLLIRNLLDLREKINADHRPIVFVCHGLGGLVCANALADLHWKDSVVDNVVKSAVGAIFLATPFERYSLARWDILAENLAWVNTTFNWPSITLGQYTQKVEERSTVLRDVTNDFHQFLQEQDETGRRFQIACYHEGLPVRGPGKKTGLIVPSMISSPPGVATHVILRDHIEVCKFADEHSQGYVSILSNLRRWISDLDNNTEVVNGRLYSVAVEDIEEEAPIKEARLRGSVDQYPIIKEIDENTDDRRFVLVSDPAYDGSTISQ